MGASYPTWWQGAAEPPPAEWAYVFEDFTGEDTAEQWALAAAIFVAQTRRRTGVGPTFAELFDHLLPDTGGLPGPLPLGLEFVERQRVAAGFRGRSAVEWRRRGMISFDRGVMRSLRVGREFRARSRRRQLSRAAQTSHARKDGTEVDEDHRSATRRLIERFDDDLPALLRVRPGWYSLLEGLDVQLAEIAPEYVLLEVSETFGALDFRAEPSDDRADREAFDGLIRAAAWQSIVTCEECGASARQYTVRLRTWTLCKTHLAAKLN